MRKFLMFFSISLIFHSCKIIYHKAPKYIKQNFGYCYDGKDTGLDTLININGYYRIYEKSENNNIIINMIFYKDGIYVTGFQDTNPFQKIPDTHNYLEEVYKKEQEGLSQGFYEWNEWGIYKLFNDTIKVRYVGRPILGASNRNWIAYEVWYKIISKNTIREINNFPIGNTSQSEIDFYISHRKKYIISDGFFSPVENIPKASGWIKNEKWFWCNQKKYENWIQEQKKKYKNK